VLRIGAMSRTLALVLVVLAACGAKTPPPTDTNVTPIAADRDAGPGQTTRHTGSTGVPVTCASSAECGQGEVCHGPEGCDVPWTCQPARPCTKDLVVYCGCDGLEHRGSGSCPPAPYKNKGPCGG
jgi:hypothetical protein